VPAKTRSDNIDDEVRRGSASQRCYRPVEQDEQAARPWPTDGRDIKLLTRTGLDWSHRYRRAIEALGSLKVKSAYFDGELCALNSEGVPVFSRFQAAMDEGRTDQLVFFAFDLLFLNGVSTAPLPLIKRKERLQRLFRKESGLRYSEHVTGDGPGFRAQACRLGLEGAISKQADRPYAPGDRGIWVKSKCLNREEFVVVGWTDPEGSRSHIGALSSATTPRMAACITPGVPAQASLTMSLSAWRAC
jgi:bifunctional non-homologous end joining protein LigD